VDFDGRYIVVSKVAAVDTFFSFSFVLFLGGRCGVLQVIQQRGSAAAWPAASTGSEAIVQPVVRESLA